MAGTLHDCFLGADEIEIIEARCDDDACEHEAAGPTDYMAYVHLRAKKAGTATVRVRARGSDGVEVSASGTVEIVPAARLAFVRTTDELDAPFEQMALAPGAVLAREVAAFSESGVRLDGLPDLSPGPEASWDVTREGLPDHAAKRARVRAGAPGVIHLELRAGAASLREDISVVAVAPSAPIRLHVVRDGTLGPALEDVDVHGQSYLSFALSAAGPDERPVLVSAASVVFDTAPGFSLRPLHDTAGSVWVTLQTVGTPPPGGSVELRARGHLVARLHWKDVPARPRE